MEMQLFSLGQMLPADHRARQVWGFVQALDLEPFYRDIEVTDREAGRTVSCLRALEKIWQDDDRTQPQALIDSASATQESVTMAQAGGTQVSTVPRGDQLERHGKAPHAAQGHQPCRNTSEAKELLRGNNREENRTTLPGAKPEFVPAVVSQPRSERRRSHASRHFAWRRTEFGLPFIASYQTVSNVPPSSSTVEG